MSSGAEDEEGEEYIVAAILRHRKFDKLVTLCLERKYSFVPESIKMDQGTHSQYAYLVHWEGYPMKDRTWEPETSLLDLGKLKVYKEANNLPPEHETFRKFYGQATWRHLSLSATAVSETGIIDYLMTKQERNPLPPPPPPPPVPPVTVPDQLAKEIRNEKLRNLNEIQKAKKDRAQVRERMVTPPVAEDDINKKKKQAKEQRMQEEMNMTEEERIEAKRKRKEAKRAKEAMATCSNSNTSVEPSTSCVTIDTILSVEEVGFASAEPSSSNTSTNSDIMVIPRPYVLPGMKPLDANTPSIRKKRMPTPPTSTPSCTEATSSMVSPQPLCESSTPNVRKSISVIVLDDSPDGSPSLDANIRMSSPVMIHNEDGLMSPRMKKSKRAVILSDSEDEPMDVAQPETSLCRSSSDGDIVGLVDIETSEVTVAVETEDDRRKSEIDDLKLENLQKEYKKLSLKMKNYPRTVQAERMTRSFSHTLNQRKIRRTQSNEQLSQFWTNGTEIELFSKNNEGAYGMSRNEIPIIKKFPEDKLPQPVAPEVAAERTYQKNSALLTQQNWERVRCALEGLELAGSVMKWLKTLVAYFSRDDANRFKTEFKRKSLSHPSYDTLRFLAIVCMTSHCQHPQWDYDPKGMSLVESSFSESMGSIRYQQSACTDSHRKCLWMELFMTLLPPRVLFLESSGKSLNGLDDDGPFRDDVFFHCMRNGAECQKDLFFKYNKPIGIQEDHVGDYMIDAAHMLSIQYGSHSRLRWYLTTGGLDINALATHIPTNTVLNLSDWLEEWIAANVNVDDELTKFITYYMRLLRTLKNSVYTLEQIVSKKIEKMLLERMNSRWKSKMELTYPHILRCSPINNVSNGGDGTHQVLSCLFQPGHVGFRDGLNQNMDTNAMYMRELNHLRKSRNTYRDLVQARNGRAILALYRVEAQYVDEMTPQGDFAAPSYNFVESDKGFKIDKMTLLRQSPNLAADEADLPMYELPKLSSPGCRYYAIESQEIEQKLIVPGNAHIELTGEVREPMSFVVQLVVLKKIFS